MDLSSDQSFNCRTDECFIWNSIDALLKRLLDGVPCSCSTKTCPIYLGRSLCKCITLPSMRVIILLRTIEKWGVLLFVSGNEATIPIMEESQTDSLQKAFAERNSFSDGIYYSGIHLSSFEVELQQWRWFYSYTNATWFQIGAIGGEQQCTFSHISHWLFSKYDVSNWFQLSVSEAVSIAIEQLSLGPEEKSDPTSSVSSPRVSERVEQVEQEGSVSSVR